MDEIGVCIACGARTKFETKWDEAELKNVTREGKMAWRVPVVCRKCGASGDLYRIK